MRAVKKPVEVRVERWDGSVEDATRVINWVVGEGGTARYWGEGHARQVDGSVQATDPELRINTLEGTMSALPGDYIIRGVAGEFYPCKPAIFAATYDTPDDPPAQDPTSTPSTSTPSTSSPTTSVSATTPATLPGTGL